MRKVLQVIICCFFVSALSAQTLNCVPNVQYKDSTSGVYPPPFDPVAYPKGGIDKPACIGKPYDFVFTIKVDSVIKVFGTSIRLDSVVLAKTGAVSNLPTGITYFCNPPSCVFVKKSTGCAILKGTTTGPAGDYDLIITGKAHVELFPAQDITFPGAIASGKYTLKVVPANNSACTTSTVFAADEIASMTNAPNPAQLSTVINIESATSGVYDFSVSNVMGQTVFNTHLSIQAGSNN